MATGSASHRAGCWQCRALLHHLLQKLLLCCQQRQCLGLAVMRQQPRPQQQRQPKSSLKAAMLLLAAGLMGLAAVGSATWAVVGHGQQAMLLLLWLLMQLDSLGPCSSTLSSCR